MVKSLEMGVNAAVSSNFALESLHDWKEGSQHHATDHAELAQTNIFTRTFCTFTYLSHGLNMFFVTKHATFQVMVFGVSQQVSSVLHGDTPQSTIADGHARVEHNPPPKVTKTVVK